MKKNIFYKGNKIFYLILGVFLSLFFVSTAYSQNNTLKKEIENIIETANGKIGVSIIEFNSIEKISLNGNDDFPMQSVYKFHLALKVLDFVDKGKLSLQQKILVRKNDLLPETWSPLRDKYPGGNVKITLDEILSYTVSQSDNNGCDILFRLVGGTEEVEKYIHQLGIIDVSIAATEEEMHKAWDVQFTNLSTPDAMAELLYKFYKGDFLSEKSKDYLLNLMINTITGTKRLKGLLPSDAIVAHKTGSSGTNEKGITAATNDAGIVFLSEDKGYVIVVFVSESRDDSETRERIIAEISKAAWDYFSK